MGITVYGTEYNSALAPLRITHIRAVVLVLANASTSQNMTCQRQRSQPVSSCCRFVICDIVFLCFTVVYILDLLYSTEYNSALARVWLTHIRAVGIQFRANTCCLLITCQPVSGCRRFVICDIVFLCITVVLYFRLTLRHGIQFRAGKCVAYSYPRHRDAIPH